MAEPIARLESLPSQAERAPRAAPRTVQESFKLSPEEFDMLCMLAAGSPAGSRSAVLRELIRAAAKAPPSAPTRPVRPKSTARPASPLGAAPTGCRPPDPELLRHLVRIGNLVNQVARGIHAARHKGTTIDVVILHFLLVVIRLELEQVRDHYTEPPGSEPEPDLTSPSTRTPQPNPRRAAP